MLWLELVTDWGSFSEDFIRYFFPAVLGPLRADLRFDALIDAVERSWT